MSPNHVHRHGSSTCYIHCKCRCAPCRAGNSKRETTRVRQKAYGRWVSPYVPAPPVREHVIALTAAGIGQKRVAELAGVRYGSIQNLIYGRQQPGPRHLEQLQRMSRTNAEKLLALSADEPALAGGARVPSKPTVRRLRALVAFGWSQSKLSALLGMGRGNFGVLMASRECTAGRHRQVADLYNRISNTPPPRATHRDKIAYSRSIRYAAERTWPLPMDWEAYDDDFARPQAPRRSAA